jgi:hypothetical protein
MIAEPHGNVSYIIPNSFFATQCLAFYFTEQNIGIYWLEPQYRIRIKAGAPDFLAKIVVVFISYFNVMQA